MPLRPVIGGIVAAFLLPGLLAPAAAAELARVEPTGESITLGYGFGIELSGSTSEVLRFKHWLDAIAEVPKGRDTLWAISRSGHTLTIRHSSIAVISSGRTQAPMTRNLINGVGEDVTILFNAHIPDSGSHWVFGSRRELIEFTAEQNLYHELAHAMHKMGGQWLYFRSEQSAIEEENVFREQLARMRHQPYHRRVRIDGEAICPSVGARLVAWAGLEHICRLE